MACVFVILVVFFSCNFPWACRFRNLLMLVWMVFVGFELLFV